MSGSALENSESVKYVMALSSFGADKSYATGPILGVHFLEERLKQIKTLNALFIRAGYFMENTLAQVGVIRQMGAVIGPLRGDLKIPLIATVDIGNFALDALPKLNFTGHRSQESQGQRDVDYTEITSIIASAIGKADLRYQLISSEQFVGFIEQFEAEGFMPAYRAAAASAERWRKAIKIISTAISQT